MPVIHFQMGENSICLTKCPHDINKKFKTRVGSAFCIRCKYNKITDYNKNFVECNYESDQSVTK